MFDLYSREEERTLLSKQKEVEAFKQGILKTEVKHEKLSYTLSRINNDIASSKKGIVKCHKRLDESKIEFVQRTRMLQAIDQACAVANHVCMCRVDLISQSVHHQRALSIFGVVCPFKISLLIIQKLCSHESRYSSCVLINLDLGTHQYPNSSEFYIYD